MESSQHGQVAEQEEQEMMMEDGDTGGEGPQMMDLRTLQACGDPDLGQEDMPEWEAHRKRQENVVVEGMSQVVVAGEGAEGGSDSETSI